MIADIELKIKKTKVLLFRETQRNISPAEINIYTLFHFILDHLGEGYVGYCKHFVLVVDQLKLN